MKDERGMSNDEQQETAVPQVLLVSWVLDVLSLQEKNHERP
jgi:hypothetical protein